MKVTIIRFKPIRPARFNANVFATRINTALRTETRRVERRFARTYSTWVHRPPFHTHYSSIGGVYESEVYTDDKVYFWVVDGTVKHYIAPRLPSSLLVYQRDFRPKTQPRNISSRSGGKSGTYVRRTRVTHPGFEAREFDVVIADETEPRFFKAVENAVASAVISSRHAYP